MTMSNYSMAILLINDQCRVVEGIYEPDKPNDKAKRTQFKTMDRGIAVNDMVIVESDTRHEMTTVLITDVDVDPDFNQTAKMQWVIGRIDLGPFMAFKAQEQQAISKIKQIERRKQRAELSKDWIADDKYNDEIKALEIYSGDDAPEVQPAAPGAASTD